MQSDHWTPSPSEFELLLSLLPEGERNACTRFTQVQDRKRAVVSRLLQRAAAAATLGLPHSAVLVERTRGGKPYVANKDRPQHAPNWNYSVSHEVGNAGAGKLPASSGALAPCAFMQAPNRLLRPTDFTG